MPRRCTVCTHPEKEAINVALVTGEPFRHIAARYGTSTGALQRHKADHLPATLAQAQDAQEVAQADNLLAQMRDLQRRTLAILSKAAGSRRDLRTALAAIGEARRNLELLGKLAGELQQEGTVSLVLSAEWIELRTIMLRALAPFPAARVALFGALEDGHAH